MLEYFIGWPFITRKQKQEFILEAAPIAMTMARRKKKVKKKQAVKKHKTRRKK